MIHIVGDTGFADGYFDLGFGIGSSLKRGINPLKNIPINNEDIWIGNLESVISDITIKKGERSQCFRIDEEAYLNARKLDIYAVANNHLMEHGNEAYIRTLNTISKESSYVGSNNERSIIFEHFGKSIGIMAFSQRKEGHINPPLYWYRPEYNEIIKEFEKIKNTDFKIIYMHWGNEFINYPYQDQKKFAHWLIDLGFDIVTGCHSHVLQGYEIYNNKHIYYSLGNFLFNMATVETRSSAIINIDLIKNDFVITHSYVIIDSDNKPRIVKEEDFPKEINFSHLNELIICEEDNEQYYSKIAHNLKKYRKKNHIRIIMNLFNYNYWAFFEIVTNYFHRRIKK